MHDTRKPPAVLLRDVGKSYRRGARTFAVLSNINLTVHPGEFLFLCGPSGGGKTTLLSIIGCLLQPNVGELWIHGQDVKQLSKNKLTAIRRFQIGFMFQRFNLIRGLNAVQNVATPMLLYGKSTQRQALEGAEQLLTVVGLSDAMHEDPRQLSVGQCQRVALARALVMKPSILLADEPTASLDSANGLRAIQLLKRLTQERSMTSIIVTHDPRVVRFADRVIVLEDGHKISDSRRRSQTNRPLPASPISTSLAGNTSENEVGAS